MPRDSQSVSQFKGIDTLSSILNIAPNHAYKCQNVIGNTGGELEAAQQPTVLHDFGDGLSPVTSMGLLDIAGASPRIVFQQGGTLSFADGPGWSDVTEYALQEFEADLGRLDYCLSNSILYFAGENGTGKVFPGDPNYYRWGIARPLTPPLLQAQGLAATSMLAVTSISRTAGATTIVFGSAHDGIVGGPVVVDSAGPWPATFAGTFRIATVPSPTTLTYANPGPNDAGPYARAAYPTTITATTGWSYGVSLGYTRNGRVHWSTLSPYSPTTGPITGAPTILSPPTDDPQVNQAAFFRNLDGGSDWQLIQGSITPITHTGDFPTQVAYIDTTDDNTLQASGQTPPYDNGTPPNGKFLCPILDRVLMCGIDDDPASVAYTGYDSINFGNPQESWCQFNRIKIGQGQTQPVGIGRVRYGGVVVFGANRRMYLLRGSLNDVVVSAPTPLQFYIEDLPYEIGCYSHYTIQSTAAGLVWLDDGLKLRLYDPSAFYPPKEIAPNLSAIFRRITPGIQSVLSSGYITLFDRDWYVLSIPVDGSATPNLTILLDVDPDPGKATGAWPLTHSINCLLAVKYQDGSTHLLAAQTQLMTADLPPSAGYLTEIPVESSQTNGIQTAQDNPLMPDAFWTGGPIGARDDAGASLIAETKMFRYINMTTGLSILPVTWEIADMREYTFDQPLRGQADVEDHQATINAKGKVMLPTFHFPQQAASPLVSFTAFWRVTGTR